LKSIPKFVPAIAISLSVASENPTGAAVSGVATPVRWLMAYSRTRPAPFEASP
jgi:hypothetical protein